MDYEKLVKDIESEPFPISRIRLAWKLPKNELWRLANSKHPGIRMYAVSACDPTHLPLFIGNNTPNTQTELETRIKDWAGEPLPPHESPYDDSST